MQFNTHEIPQNLSPWIESIFHYTGFIPDHSIERVVPTGHLFVIFELDGFTRHTFDNETLKPNADFQKAWVSGIHDQYLSISAHQDSEMAVIQFKPYGAYPFFHTSMDVLANRVVPATDVLDGALVGLQVDLLTAESSVDKFQVLESWLNSRLDSQLLPPDSVVDVINALFEEPSAKLSELEGRYDVTAKHLVDQFRRYVGVTPKVLQRVLRFNDVFVKMQANGSIEWAEVASQCGYSDQSHFIREFRRFSGFNPAEFIRSGVANEEGNFFPLDREG